MGRRSLVDETVLIELFEPGDADRFSQCLRTLDSVLRVESTARPETLLVRGRAGELKTAFVEAGGVWKMFEQTQAMRVVPFDWRSFGQLMGSTLLPR